MSPSSRSHSASTPALGATIACSSRLVRTVPSRVPRATSRALVDRLGAGEDALGRGDDDPEVRRVLALAVLRPAVDQRARGGRGRPGVLTASSSTPGSSRLAMPVERAGRRELDGGGDAEVAQRAQAEVPAHRPGDLADQPGEQVAPGRRRRRRRRWTAGSAAGRRRSDVGGVRAQRVLGRRHVVGVERAGDRAAAAPGRRPAGSAASSASASRAPAATIWPAPLRLAGVSPAASMAATTSSGSPPSTADMPVGVSAQAAAISAPRRAAKRDGLGWRRARRRRRRRSARRRCARRRPRSPRRLAARAGPRRSTPSATISGWVTAVSLISSASAVVPSRVEVEPGDLGELGHAARRRRAVRARGRACRASAHPVRGRGRRSRPVPPCPAPAHRGEHDTDSVAAPAFVGILQTDDRRDYAVDARRHPIQRCPTAVGSRRPAARSAEAQPAEGQRDPQRRTRRAASVGASPHTSATRRSR